MKLIVSVFLFILGSVSLIKTVLSINCYKTDRSDDQSSNTQCVMDAFQGVKEEDKRNQDKIKSTVFACIRKNSKEIKDYPCGAGHTSCITLTSELKDQTQFMEKGCGTDYEQECELLKSEARKSAGDDLGDFIQTMRCDYCSSDNCNNQKPKNDPRLSLAAVSAPPVTTVFIIVLSIIHILL